MKCPKCGYLGFERVERCRNCGYDFSLKSSAPVLDLNLRSTYQDEVSPLDDLTLIDAATAPPPSMVMADARPDLDRLFGEPSPSRSAVGETSGEFRMVVTDAVDDEPLIKRASPPRAPLAVRRATPETPRLRSDPGRAQTLDLALDEETPESAATVAPTARAKAAAWPPPRPNGREAHTQNASMFARMAAVAIDLLLLSAIDAMVVYFTMQICGLTLADLDILPKGPLLAFLLVQNGGYLVAFTAGGQTLGKMAAGIRVVPTDSSSLDLGHAFLRELMWFVLAVPVGLGFVTALFSRDYRGLHDRFAGTRVVRATAA